MSVPRLSRHRGERSAGERRLSTWICLKRKESVDGRWHAMHPVLSLVRLGHGSIFHEDSALSENTKRDSESERSKTVRRLYATLTLIETEGGVSGGPTHELLCGVKRMTCVPPLSVFFRTQSMRGRRAL